MAESKERSVNEADLAELLDQAMSTSNRLRTADGRDLAAVLLGRRGGLKGGKARARKLSPERRSEIAAKAAQERWARVRDGDE